MIVNGTLVETITLEYMHFIFNIYTHDGANLALTHTKLITVCVPTNLETCTVIHYPSALIQKCIRLSFIEMSSENDQLKRENERLREVIKMQKAELKRLNKRVSRTWTMHMQRAELYFINHYCARNYRPCFRENRPKRSFSIEWKRALWARFRENWVYKFGHWPHIPEQE